MDGLILAFIALILLLLLVALLQVFADIGQPGNSLPNRLIQGGRCRHSTSVLPDPTQGD